MVAAIQNERRNASPPAQSKTDAKHLLRVFYIGFGNSSTVFVGVFRPIRRFFRRDGRKARAFPAAQRKTAERKARPTVFRIFCYRSAARRSARSAPSMMPAA